jgi:type VI secretion system protein ImpF
MSDESPVRLSVLDRLIDKDPKAPDIPFDRAESVRRLKAALRRDLEWLLNTRPPVQEAPDGATELAKSVYGYGLPDICTMNLTSAKNRSGLARLMEGAIAIYEPRLTGVMVSLLPAAEGGIHLLHFVLEGSLAIEPMPEQVRFDAVLKISDGEYKVRGDTSAG